MTTIPVLGTDSQSDDRALFEKWATTGDRAGPGMYRDQHGDYRDNLVLAWWQAWQAGRAATSGFTEEQILALVPEHKIKELWVMCAYWGSVEDRAVPFARATIRAALAAVQAQPIQPQPLPDCNAALPQPVGGASALQAEPAGQHESQIVGTLDEIEFVADGYPGYLLTVKIKANSLPDQLPEVGARATIGAVDQTSSAQARGEQKDSASGIAAELIASPAQPNRPTAALNYVSKTVATGLRAALAPASAAPLPASPAPTEQPITKEWCERMAKAEADYGGNIEAGAAPTEQAGELPPRPSEWEHRTQFTFDEVQDYARAALAARQAPTRRDADRLHASIMNLPCVNPHPEDKCGLYSHGHRDARHAAAELASINAHVDAMSVIDEHRRARLERRLANMPVETERRGGGDRREPAA